MAHKSPAGQIFRRCSENHWRFLRCFLSADPWLSSSMSYVSISRWSRRENRRVHVTLRNGDIQSPGLLENDRRQLHQSGSLRNLRVACPSSRNSRFRAGRRIPSGWRCGSANSHPGSNGGRRRSAPCKNTSCCCSWHRGNRENLPGPERWRLGGNKVFW